MNTLTAFTTIFLIFLQLFSPETVLVFLRGLLGGGSPWQGGLLGTGVSLAGGLLARGEGSPCQGVSLPGGLLARGYHVTYPSMQGMLRVPNFFIPSNSLIFP